MAKYVTIISGAVSLASRDTLSEPAMHKQS